MEKQGFPSRKDHFQFYVVEADLLIEREKRGELKLETDGFGRRINSEVLALGHMESAKALTPSLEKSKGSSRPQLIELD